MTIINCTIVENTAVGGGGIMNGTDVSSNRTLTIMNSTISENTATGSGGGIRNAYLNTLTITNCTVSGNSAADSGGGIHKGAAAPAVITNTLLTGNSAKDGGGFYGGGTLTNCTIAGNTASGNGGGIYVLGTVTLYNTLVALNSNYDVYNSGGTFTGNNNLLGNGAGQASFIDGPDNIVGKNPMFVNLTGTSWKDWDLRLTAISPAINASCISAHVVSGEAAGSNVNPVSLPISLSTSTAIP